MAAAETLFRLRDEPHNILVDFRDVPGAYKSLSTSTTGTCHQHCHQVTLDIVASRTQTVRGTRTPQGSLKGSPIEATCLSLDISSGRGPGKPDRAPCKRRQRLKASHNRP